MNLDELQSVQSKERQSDSLQQLRASFYEDAGAYIQSLRDERDAAAERAPDPFDSAEVARLSDDIATAEQTVEALYERRVGKVVKMASLAAAEMPIEQEGLTKEERDLFETLVDAIEANRNEVLNVVSGSAAADSNLPSSGANDAENSQENAAASAPDGDESTGDPVPADVDAATLMGAPDDSTESVEDSPPIPPDEPPQPNESGDAEAETDSQASSPTSADGDEPGIDRTTVRITRDVGEILGIDEREYDLATDDVVTLPTANAQPLLDRGAAERLD
jgi:DNA replication factor GINS